MVNAAMNPATTALGITGRGTVMSEVVTLAAGAGTVALKRL